MKSFAVETLSFGPVRCVHKVGRKRGSGEGVREVGAVRAILEDVRDRSRLLARRFPTVFAYKVDLVPTLCRDWVMVVFEVDAGRIRTMRCAMDERERDFFEYYEIPTAQGRYLAVRVLGFVNAPGFAPYRGPIRFQDSFPA